MIFHCPREVCHDLQRAKLSGKEAGEGALYQPLSHSLKASDPVHNAAIITREITKDKWDIAHDMGRSITKSGTARRFDPEAKCLVVEIEKRHYRIVAGTVV